VHVHSARNNSAMGGRSRSESLQAIVARTDLDRFNERILDSFWDRPEYQQLHPLAMSSGHGCVGIWIS
jgi:hypothetical protein